MRGSLLAGILVVFGFLIAFSRRRLLFENPAVTNDREGWIHFHGLLLCRHGLFRRAPPAGRLFRAGDAKDGFRIGRLRGDYFVIDRVPQGEMHLTLVNTERQLFSTFGIDEHCHYHLVPRWNGDTNFMPVVGQDKVISVSLEDSYDQLLPVTGELASQVEEELA